MIKQIFNKIINKYFNSKKSSIKLNTAEYKDIDFIMWCIKDGVKHGHFISISKENIKKIITNKITSLNEIFIINFNTIPVGIIIENHLSHYHDHYIINHLNNQKLYGLEINALYITKKYRNKGIGSAILTYYEKETDYNKILARCEQNNSKKSIIFFEKLGYKKIGFNKQSKHNMIHIILEKNLQKD
ncbi:TPA: GNAT family N-acetyltransferase [Campylobacter jejuni]|nr:GNAT family N-acetyltransferase [Campylobacter lari]MCV3433328.1 GNAT family N-acetyltransferase [Campylobacter lari]